MERAIEAFHNEHKNSCYIFFQHSNQALLLQNAGLLTEDDLPKILDDMLVDIYVVNENFNWTFVRTHETGWCGPYFTRKT